MPKTSSETLAQAKPWRLPSVDEQLNQTNNEEAALNTNALKRPKNTWKYEAPEQVEEVKPLTAKDIEAIRATAFQEGIVSGHEEGFEKGHKAGFDKGHQEGLEAGTAQGLEEGKLAAQPSIDEKMSSLAKLLEQLATPVAYIEKETQNELVLLAVALSKAIIKQEVQHNHDILIGAINEGITTLPLAQNSYQIALHADDIELVTKHFGQQHITENNWQLCESGEVSRGGCRIQTESNAVDVSIERRSEQVFSQLLLSQGLVDDPRAS